MTESKPSLDFPVSDHETLAEAFAADTNCMAFVIDLNGIIRWANHAAAAACGLPREAITNVPSLTILPRDYLEERMSFARKAVETGMPVVCEGISWGLYRRTTFRPLKTPPGETAMVLIVCRPKPTDETNPHDAAGILPTIRAKVDDLGPLAVLTERELELLDLIGRGMTTAEIAARLGRSVKTVEWHRVSLGEKLNATNRVELARIALNAGLSGGTLPPLHPDTLTEPKSSSAHPETL
ncbi:MAG: PAS domain-containing protein [Phycisphaeraceae bacterium]|nr:PAS domain-containing protein [Phycisphaeraceae bacterium]